MTLRNKTIEELLDLEADFRVGSGRELENYHVLLSIYETLYKKIATDRDSDYAPSLPKIKETLIFHLIQHGTYLKTVYQKDDRAAEHSLTKALRYERALPIAHYRLGFLHYKKKNYARALTYFQNAIHFQNEDGNKTYQLNTQQLYNCNLYLANCGLFVAKAAHESLEQLKATVDVQRIPDYDLSPLYHVIDENEWYLEQNAYIKITNDKQQYCGFDEYENHLDDKNTILVDLTSRENRLQFNGKETTLSQNHVELLRYLFLNSSNVNLMTKYDVLDLFPGYEQNEIPTNTYVQNISRLKRKLTSIGIDTPVIENEQRGDTSGYYYNGQLPFCLIHRSDETFILS